MAQKPEDEDHRHSSWKLASTGHKFFRVYREQKYFLHSHLNYLYWSHKAKLYKMLFAVMNLNYCKLLKYSVHFHILG